MERIRTQAGTGCIAPAGKQPSQGALQARGHEWGHRPTFLGRHVTGHGSARPLLPRTWVAAFAKCRQGGKSGLPVIVVTEADKEFAGVWRIADVLDDCVPEGSLRDRAKGPQA